MAVRAAQARDAAAATISFGDYLAGRRFLHSNLSPEAWSFLSFALGRPEYMRVSNWSELRTLNERARLDPDLAHGAYRLWQSYLKMRKRAASADRLRACG